MIMSHWHVRRLSTQGLKTESNHPCASQVHLVGMCKGSLLKVDRMSSIALMHNKSSSGTSRWHVQGLSAQGLKTKFDYLAHSKSSSATPHWHVHEFSP